MITLGIIAIVILAGIAVIATMRGRQADEAVGILSSETKKRDTASSALGSEAELSGKQVEKAAALERKASSQQLVLATNSAPPAPYVPPDPDVIGVSRRQFFNRSLVLMMQIGLGGFGAACIAFCFVFKPTNPPFAGFKKTPPLIGCIIDPYRRSPLGLS